MSQPLAPDSVDLAEARAGSALKDFIAITKPKHQFVLLTCWATMTMAGSAPPARILITLLATSLAVASSHVFNQVIDRDIDAIMKRTRNRPLAAGRVRPGAAIAFGTVLFVLSMAIAILAINALSAWLIVIGMIFYVPIYSMWLKRKSPWCTLIGGVSGAIPTLIGWSAVTGAIGMPAFWLFVFMVIWQCPHFYALSLFRGDDYKAAGLPVVVVANGVEETQRQIVWYSLLMVASTLFLYSSGATGTVYLALAAIGGIAYLGAALLAKREGPEQAPKWGKRLFFSSYLYLALIFITAVVDRV